MNKMEKALSEIREMDELAALSSPIHALHPLSKLGTALAYILAAVSFDKYSLSGVLLMLIYPFALFSLSGVSIKTCFYKLRVVLPLVCAVGLVNPFFDREVLFRLGSLPVSGGVVSMLTLMLKGVECLMVSFLLMATTRIDALCAGLRKLHLPAMPVTLLLLTYRYIGVMTEELAVMTAAYHLRAPGQKGIHHSAWGSFLGQLLLRSMDRAEELYSSMQLRGFQGSFYYALIRPFAVRDALYLAGCLLLFVLLRAGDLPQRIGSLLMR